MADTAETNSPENTQENTKEKEQQGRTPRKAARKATRKTTAKKTTAKKTAAKKTTAKKSAPKAAKVELPDFDREALGPKPRMHALAKALGKTSKEIMTVFQDRGVRKVPQSTLSAEEVDLVLDTLSGSEEAGADDVEKIRTRVRKNVANEINQIEKKVEANLAEVLDDEADDGAPLITPAPTGAQEQYSSIFLPPQFNDEDSEEAEEGEQESEAGQSRRDEDGVRVSTSKRKRRGRRGSSRGRGAGEVGEVTEPESEAEEQAQDDHEVPKEPKALRGSTRLEAQRRRRSELREEGRKKRHIVSQAEFLARRESVERTMVVRERQRHDHPGLVTQVAVLEDDLLVEHFVTSEAQASMIGNIYLGRVQNVLPSMEAAFIDIGQGRNGVLYAGEVDWKSAGLGGRSRKIEQALKSGDQVLVQVSKDPVGQKGARLTTQISLAGRYLVYVPGGRSAGISRKLPAPERKRLKEILGNVVPGQGGAIIRTAAEGVSEEAIGADVARLHSLWEDIQERADQEINSRGAKPITLYEEPNMLVKVVRDLFNEDFTSLLVDGERAWNIVHAYVSSVAPDLAERVQRFVADGEQRDAFAQYRVDEQLHKALSRKVWLPSGGTLVIDRTEAMTVVDVNTGKFTGSGGNLEETVTRNNLEAAEEIVRQMRLRDLGGMIVVDFIDMVLPENQELVLRRLKEALGRDRTRHQVSEVTSLGLVQMTRKRLGTGLLESFSTECEHCGGRGIVLHEDPVEESAPQPTSKRGRKDQDPARHPAVVAMHKEDTEQEETKEASASIEELANAVVIEEDAQPVEPANTDDTDDTDDLDVIVSAAVERAGQEDPDEPSGADYVSALEEFEASPRRRRRTRGNSRSDLRPKPEDFAQPEQEPEKEPVEESVEESVKAVTRRSGRQRRRVVRKLSSSGGRREAISVQAPREQETPVVKATAKGKRGRRRATRSRTT